MGNVQANTQMDLDHQEGSLSLFDLKEGAIYFGFSGGRKTKRRFKIDGGVLKTDRYGDGGFTTICEYLPQDSTFEPVVTEHPQKGKKVYLYEMQDGVFYRLYSSHFGRQGKKIVSCNSKGEVIPPNNPTYGIGLDSKLELMGHLVLQ